MDAALGLPLGKALLFVKLPSLRHDADNQVAGKWLTSKMSGHIVTIVRF